MGLPRPVRELLTEPYPMERSNEEEIERFRDRGILADDFSCTGVCTNGVYHGVAGFMECVQWQQHVHTDGGNLSVVQDGDTVQLSTASSNWPGAVTFTIIQEFLVSGDKLVKYKEYVDQPEKLIPLCPSSQDQQALREHAVALAASPGPAVAAVRNTSFWFGAA